MVMFLYDKNKEDNIPEAMKAYDNWVVWYPYKKLSGFTRKFVLNQNGSINKTSLFNFNYQYLPFKEASQLVSQYEGTGLGFGFTFNHDIIGIDLDNIPPGFLSCQSKNEQLAYSVLDNARLHDAYIEKSFSGKGYHIYGLCSKKMKEQLLLRSSYGVIYSAGIEIYFAGVYLTVSGKTVNKGWNNIDSIVSYALECTDIINQSVVYFPSFSYF